MAAELLPNGSWRYYGMRTSELGFKDLQACKNAAERKFKELNARDT